MEENTIMLTEESAPQEETESAATAAAEPTEDVAGASDTIPEAEETPDVQGDTPITIPIQYNHQSRELSIEEAQQLAQKGMKFDELSPVLEKIRYIAAANEKSVAEMVDALVDSQEKQLYQKLLEQCYGDEALAKRLYEVEKSQRQARYEETKKAESAADQQARDDLAKRLADEFVEMQSDFPELTAFKDIPQKVVDTAVNKGISLTDAYLRYQHNQSKKVSAAKADQAEAAKASAGSQAAGADETTDPTIEAMLAGVWA